MLKFNMSLGMSKKEKNSSNVKRILPGSIITLFILVIVLLTVFQTTDGFTTIVDTEPSKIVTEQDYMSFTSYMLKNEVTISSENSGGILYSIENAKKVNPGDELAKVYKKNIDEDAQKRLKEIDHCIEILEKSIGDGVFTLGEATVGNSISRVYYDMMRASATGNVSAIQSEAESFLIMLNKLKLFSGNGEQMKQVLADYKKDREKQKDVYSGTFESVTAQTGGYFFNSTDGYENIYTSSDIENITYDDFVKMTEMSSDEKRYVGKLLLDYQWYLVIPTVKGISDTFSVGNEYEVSFPDNGNRTFKMKLYNTLTDSTGARSVMIFSCGIIDENFDCMRVQQVNITTRNVSGYRIPESAVCEIGGNTGVYILKDGMASFRKIVILYEGDGYYIVSSEKSNSGDYYIYLEPNDSIIIECKNMYEGKVIGG